MSELLEAIGEVYASVWSPEAIEYRRDRNLLSADERMGILLQELVGEWYGPYFLPLCSGTAYSHYEAPWSERIDPKAGVLRLGMGFGDVAVDRQAVGGLRMVPLSHPTFRPEIAPSEIMRASQKTIVVLDKRDGLHKAIPLPDLLPHVSLSLIHI